MALTCLLLVYWELTRDLFFLKNCFPIVSELFFGKEYAVKPMTYKYKMQHFKIVAIMSLT